MTSISNNKNDDEMKLLNLSDYFRIIISKCSYFIKPNTASILNEYLETIKYPLKIALSRFLIDNKNIKAKILNKHTFLEGSKVGIFLSSVSNNNFLFQNNDFINLTKILNSSTITPENVIEAEKLYHNNPLNTSNADFQHTMGILYYKMNNYKLSKKYLIDSVINLKKNEGLLNNQSEILNNCINMHQYDQPDLEECILKKPKY